MGTIVDHGNGTWTWSYATNDGPDQSQTVTVTATDSDGAATTTTFELVVSNVAPAATLSNDGPVYQAQSATVTFADQADPGVLDTAAGFHYAYDLDDDGTFDVGDGTYAGSVTQESAVVPGALLTAVGTHTVRAVLLDKDGGYNEYTTEIEVEAAHRLRLHAHTGEAPGAGQNQWLARIYRIGGDEVAQGTTNGQGDVEFLLAPGRYEYTVEKAYLQGNPNGGGGNAAPVAVSARRRIGAVQGGTEQTVNHRLSVVTLSVLDRRGLPAEGFTTTVYTGSDGTGEVLSEQETGQEGTTTVVLPDGVYGYRQSKDCYTSRSWMLWVRYGQDLNAAGRQAIVNARIWVRTGEGVGKSGYRVHVYDESGERVTLRTSSLSGRTDHPLTAGEGYTFSVENMGLLSRRYPVMEGPLCSAESNTVELEYTLATVRVHVGDVDGGIYNRHQVTVRRGDGGVGESLWTKGQGNATYYLVDGDYSYDVSYRGVTTGRYAFSVAPLQGGIGGQADDQTVEYSKAKVSLHAENGAGEPVADYRAVLSPVGIIGGVSWGRTDADGNVTLYALEGTYQYRLFKWLRNSGFLPADGFTVAAGDEVQFTYVE